MDSFLQEISEKLQEESLALSREIEPEHKALTIKAFECMADCFRKPTSMAVCGECAESCNSTIQRVQMEIDQNIQLVQNAFQNCMQGCGLKAGRAESQDLKNCVSECSNQAILNFQETRRVAKGIIRQYL